MEVALPLAVTHQDKELGPTYSCEKDLLTVCTFVKLARMLDNKTVEKQKRKST